MYKFHQRSLNNLSTVHPDLQRVMLEAITNSPYDFGVTEGLRTKERQQQLFDQGKSKTLNSRHLSGKAVDVVIFLGVLSHGMLNTTKYSQSTSKQ